MAQLMQVGSVSVLMHLSGMSFRIALCLARVHFDEQRRDSDSEATQPFWKRPVPWVSAFRPCHTTSIRPPLPYVGIAEDI